MPQGDLVFRMNYGYRALIDWVPVRSGGLMERGDMGQGGGLGGGGGGGFTQGRSGITGPMPMNSKTRPPQSQSTKKQVPGGENFRGMYWSIRNWNKPPLTKAAAGGRDEVLASLGDYNQQWLYMIAEQMKQKLFAMKEDEGSGSEATMESYRNLERFLQNEDPQGGLARMGKSMAKSTLNQDIKNYGKSITDQLTNTAATWTSPVTYAGRGRRGNKVPDLRDTNARDIVGDALDAGQDWWTAQGASSSNNNDARFSKMFKGVGTSSSAWLASFAQNLVAKGPEEIKIFAKIIEDLMVHSSSMDPSQADLARRGLDTKTAINVRTQDEGGGQTTQEKALTSSGAASAPAGLTVVVPQYSNITKKIELVEKTWGSRSGTKPIDLLFDDRKRLAGTEIEFNKMDITTSYYINPDSMQTTGHHGTTTGKRYDQMYQTASSAESAITNHYRKTIIPKYNALITLIRAGVGKLGRQLTPDKRFKDGMRVVGENMQAARNTLDTMKKVSKTDASQVRGFAARNMAQLDAQTQGILQNLLHEKNSADLRNTIRFVMHHLGNIDPQMSSNYANVMAIDINGTQGTLALLFEVDNLGRFTAVDAEVFDDVSPLQWLYEDQSINLQFQGTFAEMVTSGNYGMAADALRNMSHTGTLGKFAGFNNPDPVIAMGKIIDSRFTEVLDTVSAAFFEQFMISGMWEDVKTQIHNNAVRYSYHARKPSQMHTLVKWWEYAIRQFMVPSDETIYNRAARSAGAIAQGSSGFTDPRAAERVLWPHPELPENFSSSDSFAAMSSIRDPFWFLWAAPFVGGGYPAIGRGVQTRL